MVFRRLSPRESRFLYSRNLKPPFVETRIVRRSDPAYEDSLYNFLRVGLLKSDSGKVSPEQEMILYESIGLFSKLPAAVPSVALNGEALTKEYLIQFIRSRISKDEDHYYSDSDGSELWICYDDSNNRAKEMVTKATASLSRPELPGRYNDGISEYRGIVHVREPVNRIVAIYLWPDSSLRDRLFFCLTGREAPVVVNVPEGYAEGSRRWAEVSNEEFEKSLFMQMFKRTDEELPDWAEYEPNGPSTFPDFRISHAPMLTGETAIEITRIFDYYSRMIDTVRHGKLSDRSDERSRVLSESALLSEDEISESIERALRRKSEKASQLKPNQKYMLILVSTILPLEAHFRVFNAKEYKAFDHVVLANQTGELAFSFQSIKS